MSKAIRSCAVVALMVMASPAAAQHRLTVDLDLSTEQAEYVTRARERQRAEQCAAIAKGLKATLAPTCTQADVDAIAAKTTPPTPAPALLAIDDDKGFLALVMLTQINQAMDQEIAEQQRKFCEWWTKATDREKRKQCEAADLPPTCNLCRPTPAPAGKP